MEYDNWAPFIFVNTPVEITSLIQDIMQGMEATRCAIKSFNLMRRAVTYLCHLAVYSFKKWLYVFWSHNITLTITYFWYLGTNQILMNQWNISHIIVFCALVFIEKINKYNYVCKSPYIFLGLNGVGFHDKIQQTSLLWSTSDWYPFNSHMS